MLSGPRTRGAAWFPVPSVKSPTVDIGQYVDSEDEDTWPCLKFPNFPSTESEALIAPPVAGLPSQDKLRDEAASQGIGWQPSDGVWLSDDTRTAELRFVTDGPTEQLKRQTILASGWVHKDHSNPVRTWIVQAPGAGHDLAMCTGVGQKLHFSRLRSHLRV